MLQILSTVMMTRYGYLIVVSRFDFTDIADQDSHFFVTDNTIG